MELVINRCYGGFSISRKAAEFMAERGSERAKKELEKSTGTPKRSKHWYGYGYVEGMEGGYDRADPLLVEAVRTLGREADGEHAKLGIVNIPDGMDWEIEEYDGIEHVSEAHDRWY